MEEMNRHLKAVELDKVLLMAAQRACNDDAREAILSIRPEANLQLVADMLKKTEDAYILLAKYGGPSFGGLKNVDNAIACVRQGQCLQ